MNDIIKRYIKLTIVIVVVLILFNGIFLHFWLRHSDTENPFSYSSLKNSIVIDNENCSILSAGEKYIKENYLWAMVINNNGNIIYQYQLPDDLNRTYTIGDVADFSKWYLEDYPVTVLNLSEGIIVLGNTSNSIWKRNLSFFSKNIIYILCAVIIANIAIGILLSYIFSKFFMKDLKSIIAGIISLSNDSQPKLHLMEQGYLKEVSRAINQVSVKLEEQQNMIKAGNDMKEKWLAGVSHDIRTPLSIIVGNTEELMETEVSSDKIQQLKNIQNQSFKIKILLEDLNLINVLDTKAPEILNKTVDLCQLIREGIADLMNTYDTSIYNFDLNIPEESPQIMVHADEHLLKRAFSNILINSIKHNKKGCNIYVRIRTDSKSAIIYFEDDGIGVSAQKLEELRNINSQNMNNLHGWGVIIVKQIVGYHNGTIEFSDSVQGLQIKLTIPL